MLVKQIHTIMNSVTKEILGEDVVLQEDLSNIVDIGTKIMDAGKVDNYVKALVDRIGYTIIADRPYTSQAPSILRKEWEYGSVLQKISGGDLPDAEENDTWKLVDGQSYDQDKFTEPNAVVRYFNDKVTFSIPVSVTTVQAKESFVSPEALNRFISLIFNEIQKSMTVKEDALVDRTIGSMILSNIKYDADATGDAKGVLAVNLLAKYNTEFGQTLQVKDALHTKDFLKYASEQMMLYPKRLAKLNSVYNQMHLPRFTPKEMLHFILLDQFAMASQAWLDSDTYHNELVKLKGYETVPFWQGSGKNYSFENCSKLHAKINYVTEDAQGVETKSTPIVDATGVIGVMFDHDACAVANYNKRVTDHYNAIGEFTNYWFKSDGHYMYDNQEQCVVFYIANSNE